MPNSFIGNTAPPAPNIILSTHALIKNEETTGFLNDVSIYIQLNVFLQVEEDDSCSQ